MKKLLTIILTVTLILSLSGCGKTINGNTEKESTVKEEKITVTSIVKVFESSGYIPSIEECPPLSDSDLLDFFGIDISDVKSHDIRIFSNKLIMPDEIIIIEAANSDSLKTIKSTLENYIEYKKDETRNYDASMFAVYDNAKILVNDNFIGLFITDNYTEINNCFNSLFNK